MCEVELIAEELAPEDNTVNVLMARDEIWFLKFLMKKYNPKKIVEIGVSAGGNTVNLLKWKNKNSQLFSVDIATLYHRDNTKLTGFMVDELGLVDNFKIYRGHDYLDVCDEIGNDIDFLVMDTTHVMPGEFLTFLAALPKLKYGCVVVVHDIHLNNIFFLGDSYGEYNVAAYCTGLLFGGVSSHKKWSLKSDRISNIGAFVVDESTRNNIKDIFHILCSTWHHFPNDLNWEGYSRYLGEYYSEDCSNLFEVCLKSQSKYFNHL